ncbi:hypothetical protein ACM41_23390 [Bradyrhizobium sp. CCBAU 21362]|uniref:Uncharacterized protein n=1 Tax=Bradyrhizobium diazoefficiens SEMIA 5080 TaxID=754504 RepID=A0A837C2T5_9BRAD|nr:hypothetical protein BJA5080_08200 [Bradyrhizobium diazoefficiens SEMIA 5080]KOY04767.1 hypothetical protein AF336_40315 [Bradyrhizobium diazoefficiens]MDA9539050.1 hypothetical protein [Bradyrhizobium sp. CCBAU 21362]
MDGSGAKLLHFLIDRVCARGAVICHCYSGVGVGDEYCQMVFAVISPLAAPLHNLKGSFSGGSGNLRILRKRLYDRTATGGCSFYRLIKSPLASLICR